MDVEAQARFIKPLQAQAKTDGYIGMHDPGFLTFVNYFKDKFKGKDNSRMKYWKDLAKKQRAENIRKYPSIEEMRARLNDGGYLDLEKKSSSNLSNEGAEVVTNEELGIIPDEVCSLIEKDIFRIHLPWNEDLKKVNLLREVLLLYALARPDIGYTQSMNFVFAQVLQIVEFDVESAFWCFDYIEQECVPKYYDQDLIGAQVDILACEDMIEKELPSLFDHFREFDLELGMSLLGPTLSLFCYTLPAEDRDRFFDALVAFGSNIVVATWLALFELYSPTLLNENDDPISALQSMLSPGSSLNESLPQLVLPLILRWYIRIDEKSLKDMRIKCLERILSDTEAMSPEKTISVSPSPSLQQKQASTISPPATISSTNTNKNNDTSLSSASISNAAINHIEKSSVQAPMEVMAQINASSDAIAVSITLGWIYTNLKSTVFPKSTLNIRESAKETCLKIVDLLELPSTNNHQHHPPPNAALGSGANNSIPWVHHARNLSDNSTSKRANASSIASEDGGAADLMNDPSSSAAAAASKARIVKSKSFKKKPSFLLSNGNQKNDQVAVNDQSLIKRLLMVLSNVCSQIENKQMSPKSSNPKELFSRFVELRELLEKLENEIPIVKYSTIILARIYPILGLAESSSSTSPSLSSINSPSSSTHLNDDTLTLGEVIPRKESLLAPSTMMRRLVRAATGVLAGGKKDKKTERMEWEYLVFGILMVNKLIKENRAMKIHESILPAPMITSKLNADVLSNSSQMESTFESLRSAMMGKAKRDFPETSQYNEFSSLVKASLELWEKNPDAALYLGRDIDKDSDSVIRHASEMYWALRSNYYALLHLERIPFLNSAFDDISKLVAFFQDRTFKAQLELNVLIRAQGIRSRLADLKSTMISFDQQIKQVPNETLKDIANDAESKVHQLVEECHLLQLKEPREELQKLALIAREDWRRRKMLLSGL